MIYSNISLSAKKYESKYGEMHKIKLMPRHRAFCPRRYSLKQDGNMYGCFGLTRSGVLRIHPNEDGYQYLYLTAKSNTKNANATEIQGLFALNSSVDKFEMFESKKGNNQIALIRMKKSSKAIFCIAGEETKLIFVSSKEGANYVKSYTLEELKGYTKANSLPFGLKNGLTSNEWTSIKEIPQIQIQFSKRIESVTVYPTPDVCLYCNNEVVLVSNADIYGKSHGNGMAYSCTHCDARVGVHPDLKTPLGRLANKELRESKKRVHSLFDPLWRNGSMSRTEAYAYLANKLSIPARECHIGWFDDEMTERAIHVLQDMRRKTQQPVA